MQSEASYAAVRENNSALNPARQRVPQSETVDPSWTCVKEGYNIVSFQHGLVPPGRGLIHVLSIESITSLFGTPLALTYRN
jgi:hypothetical protein